MRTPRTRLLAVGLLAAAALAAAVPMQGALAFISPPLVLVAGTQGTGTVVAKGAAVDVPITYTCAGASSMDVHLQLTEAVGRRTAFGNAAASVPCNGQTISTTLRVQSGSATFGVGKGAASLFVFGFVCTPRTCFSGTDTFNSTIKITK